MKKINYSDKLKIIYNFISSIESVDEITIINNNTNFINDLIYYSENLETNNKTTKLISDKKYRLITDNITDYRGKINCDCSIFTSLYHHILGKNGLSVADDLFYKIFFNSKFLLFDTGNLSEVKRSNTYWYKKQSKYFKNEKDLLDHFGLEYSILGTYNTTSGVRNVVLFKNNKHIKVNDIQLFKRKVGSKKQKEGLFDFNKNKNLKLYDGTIFRKIRIGNKFFFTKKHNDDKRNEQELSNTNIIYENYNKDYLIKFYGYNPKFGLLFEWLPSFTYNRKIKIKESYIELNDVDEIIVDGKFKHIDFHW
jgi:hypothetical protein